MVEVISIANARVIFTTTEKVNKQIKDAVSSKDDSWQNKLDASNQQIKDLRDNLNKALDDSKKLMTEKNSYEKKAKADLDKVTKEKADTLEQLNKTKNDLENTKKNLNSSIENLRKEIQKKEEERVALNKKVTDAEKANKDSESKAKNDLNKVKNQYNSRIKTLNNRILQKTQQLKNITKQLKDLNAAVAIQNANTFASEAKTYSNIEVLKGTIKTQQSELQTLVRQAKIIDSEREKNIQVIKNQIAIERQNFVEQIKAIQEADVQNLLRIEKLNNFIQRLMAKNQKLEEAGKILEKTLMTKINALQKRQALHEQQYELLANVCAKAEVKNLITIDQLKQDLNNAILKNQSLLQFAVQLNEAKKTEDAADSRMEVNMLLKIENLKNELNKAIQKNDNFIKNIKTTMAYIDNFKKNELSNATKYQNEIKALTNNLKIANDRYGGLLQKYNNRKNWTIESLNIPANVFSKNLKNLRNRTLNNFLRSNDNGWMLEMLNIGYNPRKNSLIPSAMLGDQAPQGEDRSKALLSSKSSEMVSSDDDLVNFALDTTLKAVRKIANYDENKMYASLRLLGAETEMPKKLSAIVDVIKDKYNPTVYKKVVAEISKMYDKRNITPNFPNA